MNTKLVESLVQMVESLSAEDYALFQQKLTGRIIQKTAGVCGGNARIRNTRIPVWTIISLQNQGAGDREILENFPILTPFDLIAARVYYQNNVLEIDREIGESDNFNDEYI